MKRITQMIALFAAVVTVVLSAVSCTKTDQTQPEVNACHVELNLTATLGNSFTGTATSTAQALGDAGTKAPITGAWLPTGKYLFSLALLNSDKVTPIIADYGNIQAELTVKADASQSWRYKIGTADWKIYLSTPVVVTGDVWMTAIYPYHATTAIAADGSGLTRNFELTSAAQMANQTDILYSPMQKIVIAAGDRAKALMLNFKHFYALFEFQIAPMFLDRAQINNVAIQSNNPWISNSGTFNSAGALTVPTYGIVAKTDTRQMTMGSYTTYQVMVPPSVLPFTEYADGDISVQFTDAANTIVQPAPLRIKREWLAPSNGLTGGNRYIFRILYANSFTAEGKLTVTDWAVNGVWMDGLGVGAPSDGMLYWGSAALTKTGSLGTDYTIANSVTESYNGYNNTPTDGSANGGYKADLATAASELPFYQLEVAKDNEGSTAVAWAEAWSSCKSKTTDGGGWRLPRMSELMLMKFNQTGLAGSPGFTDFAGEYWSGTESSAGNSHSLNFTASTGNLSAQTEIFSVRCVRELPIMLPTP